MCGIGREGRRRWGREGRCQGKTCEQEMWVFLEGRKTQGYRKGLCEGRDSFSEEADNL